MFEFSAEFHSQNVYGDTDQPGSKGSPEAESVEFSKSYKKRFLSQIISSGHISGELKHEIINIFPVSGKKSVQGGNVAPQRAFDEIPFRRIHISLALLRGSI
jgi:hypothetical protein